MKRFDYTPVYDDLVAERLIDAGLDRLDAGYAVLTRISTAVRALIERREHG